jgi:hypothetical protein
MEMTDFYLIMGLLLLTAVVGSVIAIYVDRKDQKE